jgi:DinB superfamily
MLPWLTTRCGVARPNRWITGPVLAQPEPVHALGWPNPPYEDLPRGIFDLDARPTLDEVLIVRHGRMNAVQRYVRSVTEEQLNREVTSPNGEKTTVRRCLQVVFKEEWWHNQCAIRDLTVLEHR